MGISWFRARADIRLIYRRNPSQICFPKKIFKHVALLFNCFFVLRHEMSRRICQVHDLTMIKFAWEKLLREIGAVGGCACSVQTKELGGDGLCCRI